MLSKIFSRHSSIRTRILFTVLSLIVVIFLVILAVFNLLMEEYIKNSVQEQLKGTIQIISYNERSLQIFPPGELPAAGYAVGGLPSGPLGKAEMIVVTGDYQLVFSNTIFGHNFEEVSALVTQMKAERVDLQSTEIMRLKASGREYYFVSMQLPDYVLGQTSYLVCYFDMTALTAFAGRINAVLLAVMGMAAILAAAMALFLSGMIARPIGELSRFAVRIGRGDFTQNIREYKDRELAELAWNMNKAAAQLAAYDKEQKTFFQNVSHELRTPLQSIRCNAEGIEQGILDHKNASRVIVSETDRLSDMVEDLLCLSRMDSNHAPLRREECDLREILSNCAERHRSLAGERHIQFVFDFDDQPVNFPCDEKHLSRAFANLIANALRYARNTITLSCRRTPGKITAAVADDGTGIAEEDLPHLFDRFYKGRGGKHGIGLSIVKSIIEQHHGRIEVRNSAEGAAFIITFQALA